MRSLAAVLPVLLAPILLAAEPADARRPAPVDPAACANAAAATLGRTVQRALRCQSVAAARGKPARGCTRQGAKQFVRALRKAGRTCPADPEAQLALVQGLAVAEALGSMLRPVRGRSRCTAAKLAAAGDAAQGVFAARAEARRSLDMVALQSALSGLTASLEAGFAAAEAKGDCQSWGDFTDTTTLLQVSVGLAGRLTGVLQISKSLAFPEGARQDVLDNRATLEAEGWTVAGDGSTLTGPPAPAAGWIAALGDARARVDAEGRFSLDVQPGSALEGALFHPANRNAPVARFFVTELSGPLDLPRPIALELATQGSCQMNVDPADDPPSCHAGARAAHLVERSRLNPDPVQFPPLVEGRLGTYPNDDPNAEQVACLDYDGFIQTGERGDRSLKGAISYPGSTCQKQVDVGCCDNEAATIRRRLLNLVDEYRFPVLHCPVNHKFRFCQSVKKGDIAVEAKGQIALAGGSIEVTVQSGEKVDVTVHNNACYGETHVSPGLFNDLGGVLVGDRFDGETLLHWEDPGGYRVDSPLLYWTPADCPGSEASDKFDFEADGSEAQVVFRCVTTTTTTLPCQPGRDYSCRPLTLARQP